MNLKNAYNKSKEVLKETIDSKITSALSHTSKLVFTILLATSACATKWNLNDIETSKKQEEKVVDDTDDETNLSFNYSNANHSDTYSLYSDNIYTSLTDWNKNLWIWWSYKLKNNLVVGTWFNRQETDDSKFVDKYGAWAWWAIAIWNDAALSAIWAINYVDWWTLYKDGYIFNSWLTLTHRISGEKFFSAWISREDIKLQNTDLSESTSWEFAFMANTITGVGFQVNLIIGSGWSRSFNFNISVPLWTVDWFSISSSTAYDIIISNVSQGVSHTYSNFNRGGLERR